MSVRNANRAPQLIQHGARSHSSLILRSRVSGVTKDEADMGPHGSPGDAKHRPATAHSYFVPFADGLAYARPARAPAPPHHEGLRSMRQRIGPHLHLEHFRIGVLAAFAVEIGARAGGGPDAAAFPALGIIVDPAVDILG